jgi:hypothetical protein
MIRVLLTQDAEQNASLGETVEALLQVSPA